MKTTYSHNLRTSIRKASRLYSDTSILMHEAIARKAELSGTDHKYLGLLIQQGPMTAGEFATLTGLTTGSVTGLVDRLEKKQLAKREFDKTDRRKIIIVPETDHALQLLSPIFKNLDEKTNQLLDRFSDQELKIIQKYLTEAVRVMSDATSELNNKK